MVKQAMDPFFTTKTTRRVGLGLPAPGGSVPACATGNSACNPGRGKGTTVRATFQTQSHRPQAPGRDRGHADDFDRRPSRSGPSLRTPQRWKKFFPGYPGDQIRPGRCAPECAPGRLGSPEPAFIPVWKSSGFERVSRSRKGMDYDRGKEPGQPPVEISAEQWKKIDEIIERYKHKEGTLIPVLKETQEVTGYLPAGSPALRRRRLEAPAQPDLRGGHLLFSLYHDSPRAAHRAGLPGYRLLRARRAGHSGSDEEGVQGRRERDDPGPPLHAGSGQLPGNLRPGPGACAWMKMCTGFPSRSKPWRS